MKQHIGHGGFPNWGEINPGTNNYQKWYQTVFVAPDDIIGGDLSLLLSHTGSTVYNESTPTKPADYTVAIHYPVSAFGVTPPASSIFPVYCRGSRIITIAPGQRVETDKIQLPDIPEGERVAVRIHVNIPGWSAAADTIGMSRVNRTAIGEGTGTGGAAGVDTGAVTAGNINELVVAPTAILSSIQTPRVAVLESGDSIPTGAGDVPTLGNVGWVDRGIDNRYAILSVSRNSEHTGMITGIQFARRQSLGTYCTHAIVAWGTNDLTQIPASLSVATFEDRVIERINAFTDRGLDVMVATVIPRATSQDAFKSIAAQVRPSSESYRQTINAHIRDTTTLAGIKMRCKHPERVSPIDVAATLEVDNTGALNPTGGYFRLSSVIDSGTATGGTSTSLTDTSKAWVTNSLTGKYVLLTGGTGSGGATTWRQIVSNTATQITFTGMTPGVGTTYEIIDAYAHHDGTHPSPLGHDTMSQILLAMDLEAISDDEKTAQAVRASMATELARIDRPVSETATPDDLQVTVNPPAVNNVTLAASQPNYAPAKLSDLQNAIGALAGRKVEIPNPVADGGKVRIIIGDDYNALDGRSLKWIVEGTPLDLLQADITLGLEGGLELTGEATLIEAGKYLIAVNIENIDTSGLAKGWFTYQLAAEVDGRRNTLLLGRVENISGVLAV